MKRLLRIVGIVVAVLVAIAVALCAAVVVMYIGMSTSTATVTKVSAYPDVLEEWTSTGLVDHFPRTIPANATNVSLVAYPGAMQGSGFFQLRETLPLGDVQAILAETKASAIRSCPGQCPTGVEEPEFWHVPSLIEPDESEHQYPPDFVIYALETNGDWNHPSGKGVAISTARSEVVYWAEQ